MSNDRQNYASQKCTSKKRDIEFKFTFDEWIEWWKNALGPEWRTMRGRERGQYVMARKGDDGPYSPENVECKLHEQNDLEGAINGRRKLTHENVLEIFHSTKPYLKIAKEFEISEQMVFRIKRKKSWESVLLNESKKSKLVAERISPCQGVTWNKIMKKWRVRVSQKIIGHFINETDAIAARKQAENNLG